MTIVSLFFLYIIGFMIFTIAYEEQRWSPRLYSLICLGWPVTGALGVFEAIVLTIRNKY